MVKSLLSPVRTVLGMVLTFFDRITRPKPVERDDERQQQINDELRKMALYQFHGCPFCVKVRRSAHRLNLDLELRDARNDEGHREELTQGGGKVQVPCLRIDREDGSEWMYESDDIIDYLEERFG